MTAKLQKIIQFLPFLYFLQNKNNSSALQNA